VDRPTVSRTLFLLVAVLLSLSFWAPAQEGGKREGQETVDALYRQGFALQQERRTLEAIAAFEQALRLNPEHGPSHYEIGWSYWVLQDWPQVVRHWDAAERLKAGPPEFPDYLREARSRLKGEGPPIVRVAMGTRAPAVAAAAATGAGAPGAGATSAAEAPLALELTARFQHYNPAPQDPRDVFDQHVFSPKSVAFSPDGAKAYVNALEGMATAVYDARNPRKLKVIVHRFGAAQAGLFDPAETAAYGKLFKAGQAPAEPNHFSGKPVESALTHGGRYLWVSYYRRDYDRYGNLPSAVAIVDTRTDSIVRVMHTGPIPKFMTASPDGRWLAVIHWGDNSVDFIDVSAPEPAGFRHAGEAVVGKRLPLVIGQPVDRDHYCGYCLRGAAFTADSRYLLVGRMGGGGVAVIDVQRRATVGTVTGMRPTPRHLVLSPDGARLYLSSNVGGYVSVYRPEDLVAAALAKRTQLRPLEEIKTGAGTRTIALSPDGALLFAAVNRESKLAVLQAAPLRKLFEIAADSYPVGLAASPAGDQVWVTSQGVKQKGGNSVSIYTLRRGPEAARPSRSAR
jgi:DNA-binding beta-propeller fold protein YncE